MRSIGKWKIKKLNNIIEEEYIKSRKEVIFGYEMNHRKLEDTIENKIPEEWYDIWESAWSEIRNLIDDKITDLVHDEEFNKKINDEMRIKYS